MTSLSAKYGWQNLKNFSNLPLVWFLIEFVFIFSSDYSHEESIVISRRDSEFPQHLSDVIILDLTLNSWPDWPLVRRYLLPRQGLVADVLSRRVDQAAVGEVKYLLVSLTQASNMTFTAVEWGMRIPGNSQHSQSYNPNIFIYRTPIKYSWHYHSCCSVNVCKLNLLSSDGEVLTLLSW